jgi:hypothetical protein
MNVYEMIFILLGNTRVHDLDIVRATGNINTVLKYNGDYLKLYIEMGCDTIIYHANATMQGQRSVVAGAEIRSEEKQLGRHLFAIPRI